MQAMARALSDDYGQQMQAPASVLSRASCDNASLASIGNSFGSSAYGSMQSERHIMASPFNHTVSTSPETSCKLLYGTKFLQVTTV